MASTAKKLKNAEQKIAKAQKALDKTQTGLRAAEEVVSVTQKASRRPIVIALVVLTLIGLVWMFTQNTNKG